VAIIHALAVNSMCRADARETGEKNKGSSNETIHDARDPRSPEKPYRAESGLCLCCPFCVMDALSHFVSFACTLPEALKVAQY
jgi:hypothetical protein